MHSRNACLHAFAKRLSPCIRETLVSMHSRNACLHAFAKRLSPCIRFPIRYLSLPRPDRSGADSVWENTRVDALIHGGTLSIAEPKGKAHSRTPATVLLGRCSAANEIFHSFHTGPHRSEYLVSDLRCTGVSPQRHSDSRGRRLNEKETVNNQAARPLFSV